MNNLVLFEKNVKRYFKLNKKLFINFEKINNFIFEVKFLIYLFLI